MVTCVEGVHMAASLIECWPFNDVFRNCKDSSVVEPPLSYCMTAQNGMVHRTGLFFIHY